MLLIDCPWCGPRDEIEFRWGGESHLARPEERVGDAEWSSYLFFHDNPKGVSFERWHHEFGCRSWFNVVRDTTTHKILKIYAMGTSRPEIVR